MVMFEDGCGAAYSHPRPAGEGIREHGSRSPVVAKGRIAAHYLIEGMMSRP